MPLKIIPRKMYFSSLVHLVNYKLRNDPMCGCAEIWDALRAAAEADINLAQLIVDSAGIIVQSEDLSTCYDERGHLCTL